MTKRIAAALTCAATLLVWGTPASAQVLGVFTWQMQPYCNKVVLTLTTVPTGFMLHGFDDQCGHGPRASAVGTAVLNPNGTAGVNFTILAPGGPSVQVEGIVTPATGQGTWSDNLGHAGTFALGGATPGLPARPAVAARLTVAENPRQPGDPCAQPVQPVMQYCGTSSAYWSDGGYGGPGLQVWRDAQGLVHIRGSATRSTGTAVGAVFVLPPALRPKRLLVLPVLTGGFAGAYPSGTAMVVVYPEGQPSAGVVAIFNASTAGQPVAHFGEIVFSLEP
jgi:hypothetical protein